MKNIFMVAILIFLINICVTEESIRTIQVNGTCSISIDPDVVKFHVNISSVSDSLKSAKDKNDKIFQSLIFSLKGKNIPQNDIELSGIQYKKHTEYVDRKYVHRGYKASQDVTIKLKNFSLFEEILSLMVENNDINFTLGFESSKSSEKKLEALKKALEKAKIKADQMASVYGIKVGVPVSIIEQSNSYNVSVSNAYLRESDQNRSNLFNQVTITATVVVKFQLK